jgi:hypothetical protein
MSDPSSVAVAEPPVVYVEAAPARLLLPGIPRWMRVGTAVVSGAAYIVGWGWAWWKFWAWVFHLV